MKHAVVGLHLVHVFAWAAAAVQSVLQQLEHGVSADVLLAVAFLGGASVMNLVLAVWMYRERRAAALWSALLFGGSGFMVLMLAVPMVVLPLLGPADPYILPLGVIGAVVGGVHAVAGRLAWRLQETWQVSKLS